ncbi:MAG: FKBP-type peptidyl-prolyl cis-trans isomerase [Opitutales bacterium]
MQNKVLILTATFLSFAVSGGGALLLAQEGAPATEKESAAQAADVPDVPKKELVRMVGYFTAQQSGVASLDLDEAGIEAVAEALRKGLTGERTIDAYDREAIDEAVQQAGARAQAVSGGEDEAPEMSASQLEKLGVVMVVQSGLNQLEFDAEEADLVYSGFIEGAGDATPDEAMREKMPAFQEFLEDRARKAQAAREEKNAGAAASNIEAGEDFLEELKKEEDDLKSTESGLHYKIEEPGEGEKPTMDDTVLVHYKGTRIDGSKFDSSHDRGEAAEFPLNGVVPGFGEGLTKVAEGGKITLYIPSKLGYGKTPPAGSPIEPGDLLIFECELLEIK